MRIYKTLMNKTFIYLLIAVLAACKSTPYSDETTKSDLRAPAYPLLTLHPHVKLWSMTDELNKQNMTFGGSTQLPFVGFLRVDGAMYRFMGSKELPMQAIAPMALDHEKWEGKFTSLVPDEGWEQPDFDDKYWQLSEGAFGTPGMWEARTQWTSSNIWVRREVEVDPYLLEHKKIYLRYSHDDVFQLYINGKQLVNTGYDWGANFKVEVPDSILQTMKSGKALIAAHCENRVGGGLVDFGLFAEEPTMPVEKVAPISYEKEWTGRYTMEQPQENWEAKEFDDTTWTEGQAAFGTDDQRNVHTPWFSPNIWVRRELTFDPALVKNKQLYLRYSHDDVFELYLNGEKLVSTGLVWKNNVYLKLSEEAKKKLRKGKNVIAAHCHNTTGGSYVDFGLFREKENAVKFANEAVQKSVDVLATSTYYTFTCGPVELDVVFTAPQLIDDLDLLSTPINYVSYHVRSLDKKTHDVQFYMETTPELAINESNQPTVARTLSKNGISYVEAGSIDQPICDRRGDLICADWGYAYLASTNGSGKSVSLGDYYGMKESFVKNGTLATTKTKWTTRKEEDNPAMAYVHNLGSVSNSGKEGFMMLGYDDIYSIEYMYEKRMGYWKHDGKVTIFERQLSGYYGTLSRL